MSAFAADTIVPKHGAYVHVESAQLTYNATHGTFTASGSENASGDAVDITGGYYITLNPPFANISIAPMIRFTGSGAAITLAGTAVPAAARPVVETRLPALIDNGGTAAWGMALIATSGAFTYYADVTGGGFVNGSVCGIQSFSGSWSTQAY